MGAAGNNIRQINAYQNNIQILMRVITIAIYMYQTGQQYMSTIITHIVAQFDTYILQLICVIKVAKN